MRGVVSLSCVVLVGVASASTKLDPAVEARMRAEVAAASADAAVAWDRGNTAREAQRFDEAEAAYRKAAELAPKVDHPHRRLCGILAWVNRVDEALTECELALSLAPQSAYDKSAVAGILIRHGTDRLRGVSLARESAQAMPDDVDIVSIDCAARASVNDLDGTSSCVEHLLKLAPQNVLGNDLEAEIALARGNYELARIRADVAKDAGLPPAAYDELRGRIDAAKRRDEAGFPISLHDALVVGIPLVAGWFVLLALLLVVGRVLSQAVLRGAGHDKIDQPVGTARERRLRRAYRMVLVLTGALFYLSLPLMIFVVIAAAIVTLAIFEEMGGIPIFVIGVPLLIVVSTVISIVRALFYKPTPKIEGQRIDLPSFPKLTALLAQTAEEIETPMVDVVYLTPGTDAFVLEYRSLRRALFGRRGTRVLVLGVGLFDGMKQRELRAILAHEYGHFRNADTGGRQALALRSSLETLLRGLAASKYAYFNPAWWLVRSLTHLYLLVSSGASRLQELLADRWAIRAHGSEAFVAGLRHVVRREVELAAHVAQTIKDVVANKWSLPNLYEYDPDEKPSAAALEAAIDKRMNRTSRFDSHPCTRDRIAWAEQAALPGDRTRADDLAPVWDLFPDPDKVERDMTAIIRARIRRTLRVTISDAEWTDAAAEGTGDAASGS